MKEGELKGERGEIEVQPSEYEKGMYHNKQMPKFFAPIFHPSIGLETCHFFGGTVYHYPTTETQHENLKKYLLWNIYFLAWQSLFVWQKPFYTPHHIRPNPS